MRTPAIIFATLAILGARAHADDGVRHLPTPEATAGKPVDLVAEAAPATAAIVLHYRTSGTGTAYQTVELVKRTTDWVATLPATAVVAPGVDYYLAVADKPVFASPELPYTMRVTSGDDDARTARDLVRTHGARSRIHSSFEWVDFGTRSGDPTKPPVTLHDRYYRIDADFAYHLLAYPLEEIRVGYTRLIGDTPDAMDQAQTTGFKVAGWFELGLAPLEGVRLDGRVMVLATSQGFGVGARGELRFGDREGNHVAIGTEYIADLGANGYVRLGWATVPGLPMAATVEISQFPSPDNSTGVRIYYDIARDFAYGIRAGLRAGYAARSESVLGYTTGINASVDF